MPLAYVVALLVVVLVILATRLVLPSLPLRGFAVRLSALEAVLAIVALVALAFHCGSMFFRPVVRALPGTSGAITEINALGTVSVVAFVVPSLLLILALRRLPRIALAALATALTAVGITMYDGGSLMVHLTALFVTLTLLALGGATLLRAPSARPATVPAR